ncbi:hypothetical protein PG999_008913 [Apiospora kogelbergensis]|uniref:Uncharacterized protein n=1 Tax=Apiospora kogelbergensis TaxID=1337665 RepID=A0AAW0QPP3_9PEZI
MLTYEKKLYEDLGHFYAQGSDEAAADWEGRRKWMLKRADLNSGMVSYIIKTYYKSFIMPEDEPEAFGDRGNEMLIQQARLKYGYKLTHRDLELWYRGEEAKLQNEVAAALAPIIEADSKAVPRPTKSQLPVPRKPVTKMCFSLRPITEESGAPGYHMISKPKANDIVFVPGRHDLPGTYQHLVTDLDMGPDVPKVSVTAVVVERSATLPMPLLIADDWQKEAVTVLRVLVRMIERKVASFETTRETLDLKSLNSFRRLPRKI